MCTNAAARDCAQQADSTSPPPRAGCAPYRPPGAGPGAWPVMPWWHSCFYDPYERVNVWSHGLPAAGFAVGGILGIAGLLPMSLAMILLMAGGTAVHLFSTLAHVWPESHFWEKMDHLGIVTMAYTTLTTAVMANNPEADVSHLYYLGGCLVVAAFLPKKPRILGIGACVFYMVYLHWEVMGTTLMSIQIAAYAASGLCFWHNAGHDRPEGFSDHHLLHYLGTFGSMVHIFYILNAEAAWRDGQASQGYAPAAVAHEPALHFPGLDAQLQTLVASGMMALSGLSGESD